jgi:hypothetical protein
LVEVDLAWLVGGFGVGDGFLDVFGFVGDSGGAGVGSDGVVDLRLVDAFGEQAVGLVGVAVLFSQHASNPAVRSYYKW